MARLTTRGRKRLAKSQFALPAKDGYPIHDVAHARNALARAAQHATPAQRARIRRKVHARYPGIAMASRSAPKRS